MKSKNVTAWDVYWIIAFCLFIMIVLVAVGSVDAAEACRTHYVVRPRDTLRIIADKYDTEPWYLVRANRVQAERPNYPIYAWSSLCIPYNEGVAKVLPDRFLDQPAGEMLFTQRGQKLTVRTANFGLGSNWTIRAGNEKLGKLKIVKKAMTEKTVNAPAKLQTACLKNQRTDFVLCGKVRQVR